MWLVTIIVLALAAFFTMKVLKSQDLRKAAEKEREMQRPGLEGSLNTQDSVANANLASGASESASSTDLSPPSDMAPAGGQTTTESASAAESSASKVTVSTAAAFPLINSGDLADDIREMIKILNLAEPDAGRLAITREEFTAIRHGDDDSQPSGESLTDIADRLRNMLA
jgi:hypothetical protein